MKKLLLLIVVALTAWGANAAEERLLVNENFHAWSEFDGAGPYRITRLTDYSQENLTYTCVDMKCITDTLRNSRWNTVDNVGSLETRSVAASVELSPLASITRVQFTHGATGSNRGYKLEKKVGAGEWELVSDAVAAPDSGAVVSADINAENVALRFSNVSATAANSFLFDLKIWGNSNDVTAPTILFTIPQNGSRTLGQNGTIELTFSEKVMLGTGDFTFSNGEVLTAKMLGTRTVVLSYSGLRYEMGYILNIPVGAVTDLSGNPVGNKVYTFTTMSRSIPNARLFDAVVAQDSTGDYTTIKEAVDSAPANREIPWLIFIKNGSYKQPFIIPKNKTFIHLIGQNRDSVIIRDKQNVANAGENGWEFSHKNKDSPSFWSEGSVVRINGANFYAENISFYNDWGIDEQNGPQALALRTQADKMAFNNCSFRSFQDTWQTSANDKNDRVYVNNCWIEGAVDYLYGAANAYVENTTFYNVRRGSVIVAPSHAEGVKGYVIRNCVVDGNAAAGSTANANREEAAQQKLGRPWHNYPRALYINTIMKIRIHPEGWSDMGPAANLFAEYNSMNAEGQPLDLGQRKSAYKVNESGNSQQGQTVTGKQTVLTDNQVALNTYDYCIASDGWNPRAFFEPVAAPANLRVDAEASKLLWDASEYAISYVVLKGGQVIDFTLSTEYDIDAAEDSTLFAVHAVGQYGSLSPLSIIKKADDTGTETAVVKPAVQDLGVRHYTQNGQLILFDLPENANVELYNAMGQKLFDGKATSDPMSIPVSGFCIARVSTSSGVQVIKAVVK